MPHQRAPSLQKSQPGSSQPAASQLRSPGLWPQSAIGQAPHNAWQLASVACSLGHLPWPSVAEDLQKCPELYTFGGVTTVPEGCPGEMVPREVTEVGKPAKSWHQHEEGSSAMPMDKTGRFCPALSCPQLKDCHILGHTNLRPGSLQDWAGPQSLLTSPEGDPGSFLSLGVWVFTCCLQVSDGSTLAVLQPLPAAKGTAGQAHEDTALWDSQTTWGYPPRGTLLGDICYRQPRGAPFRGTPSLRSSLGGSWCRELPCRGGCSEGKGRSADALEDLLRRQASCLHSSEENMGVGQWFWTSCG